MADKITPYLSVSGGEPFAIVTADGSMIVLPLSVDDGTVQPPDETFSAYSLQADPVPTIDAGEIPDDMIEGATITVPGPVIVNDAGSTPSVTWAAQWHIRSAPLGQAFIFYDAATGEADPLTNATALSGETSASLVLDTSSVGFAPILVFTGTDPEGFELQVIFSPDGTVKSAAPEGDLAILTRPVIEVNGQPATIVRPNQVIDSLASTVWTKNGSTAYTLDYPGADVRGAWLQSRADGSDTEGGWNSIFLTGVDHEGLTEQVVPANIVGQYVRIVEYAESPRGGLRIKATSTPAQVLAEPTEPPPPGGPTLNLEEYWDHLYIRPPAGKNANTAQRIAAGFDYSSWDGLPGATGQQHHLGGWRHRLHPEYIYFMQDVALAWISSDNMRSISHVPGIGFGDARNGSCVIADPDDPETVLFCVGETGGSFPNGAGIFRSTDLGQTVTQVLGKDGVLRRRVPSGARSNNGFTGRGLIRHTVQRFGWSEVDRNLVVYVNPLDGLYVSTNRGQTWALRNGSQVQGMGRIFDVFCDFHNADVLHIAAEDGYFRCDNVRASSPTITKRGQSNYPNQSTQVSGGAITGGDWCTSLWCDPNTAGHLIMVIAEEGAFESTNNGNNWTRRYSRGDIYAIAVHDSNPNHMYVVRQNGHPYRTTTGWNGFSAMNAPNGNFQGADLSEGFKTQIKTGASWGSGANSLNERNGMCRIYPHPTDTSDALANGGAALQRLQTSSNSFVDACSLGFDTMASGESNEANDGSGAITENEQNLGEFVINCFDVGGRRSLDGGSSFVGVGSPGVTGGGHGFCYHGAWSRSDQNRYVGNAGLYQQKAGVGISNNIRGSASWSGIVTGSSGTPKICEQWCNIHPTNANVIYMASFRSTNGGSSRAAWGSVSGSFPSGGRVMGMSPSDGDCLWARSSNGSNLYYSQNQGNSWTNLGSVGRSFGNKSFGVSENFSVHPNDRRRCFVVGNNGGVLEIVLNAGGTAVSNTIDHGLPGYNPSTILLDGYAQTLPGAPFVLYAFSSGTGHQRMVMRKIGESGTWENVSFNAPRVGSVRNMTILRYRGTVALMGTVGIYLLQRPSSVYGPPEGGSGINPCLTVTANTASKWRVPVDEPEPADDIETVPANVISTANSMALLQFDATGNGVQGATTSGTGRIGPAAPTLALASWQGTTSTDARVLAQIRAAISGGDEPQCGGNYSTQHEIMVTSAMAIARNTPRIWNALTTNERSRCDTVMRASAAIAAYMLSAVGSAVTTQTDGASYNRANKNSNHRVPKGMTMIVAAAYFGQTVLHNWLRNYNHTAFRSELSSFGFSNILSFFTVTPTGSGSTANFENKIRGGSAGNATGWRAWYGNLPGVSDPIEIMYQEVFVKLCKAQVVRGIGNNQNGINVGGTQWGTMISNSQNLPNHGQNGGFEEFDSFDADGDRSDVGYVLGGYSPVLAAWIACIVAGQWDKDDPRVTQITNRFAIGHEDLIYKLRTAGYRDYSRGAARLEWVASASLTGGMSGNHGMVYRKWMGDAVLNYHGITTG